MQHDKHSKHPHKRRLDKSLYRPTPVRAVVRDKNYRKLAWQWCNTNIFRPLGVAIKGVLFGLGTLGKQIIGIHQKHPKQAKRFWQAVALAALIIIPARILLKEQPAVINDGVRIEHIVANQIVTVATTKNDQILFQDDGLSHGFGNDIARQYAEHLGVELALVTYTSEQQALQAVQHGAADFALIGYQDTLLTGEETVAMMPVACQSEQGSEFAKAGLADNLVFMTANKNGELKDNLQDFLCNAETIKRLSYLAKFHDRTLLKNEYNAQHFSKAVRRLPLYEYAFKLSAKEFDHDWHLLAMVGYQESHLNTKKMSPTGVQGMMMLTQDTAKQMGVKDRNDVVQSIHGGAKYLQILKKQFAHIDASDRLWFVLASYNMGPNAVRQIQSELKAQGKNPNSWLNVYIYLNEHIEENSRYAQCLRYVTNIRNYIEAIKLKEASAQKQA